MPTFDRSSLRLLLLLGYCVALGYWFLDRCTVDVHTKHLKKKWSPNFGIVLPPSACFCPEGAVFLKDSIPDKELADIIERRANEYKKHKARTSSSLETLLFAPSNSPLQYPIQGWSVRPLVPTLIPGLAVHSEPRSSYKVSLNVSRGVLSLGTPADAESGKGGRKSFLILETESLEELNKLLEKVTYTSTVYHIHTGDLAHFVFEYSRAVFPVVISQPAMPVFHDMGTDLSHHVTVVTKTFMRYKELRLLISSLRRFYKDVLLIVADDTFEMENVTERNVLQFLMPGGQGWFAGRTLAVSQVTTKYFLWVDDDFLFTEQTKIEDLVEVMEATPELDVVGGSVTGNQYYFSMDYEQGDGVSGGCIERKTDTYFHALPNYPQCFMVSAVVNFFLARTDAVKRVRFDPKLKRVGHSEFFIDGLGQLMVATCSHVSIGHQTRMHDAAYREFRRPKKEDEREKKRLQHYKNVLKCINRREPREGGNATEVQERKRKDDEKNTLLFQEHLKN